MKRALPPSPEYYLRFVRGWCAGPDDSTIRVTEGKRAPHVVSGIVEVGADWLHRQGVPRAAVEEGK
jgi:hypothetical protein